MARLVVTMETMHAVGRRNLPPVPRAAADTLTPTTVGSITATEATFPAETVAPVSTITPAPTGTVDPQADADADADAEAEAVAEVEVDVTAGLDAGQVFVARLRADGAAFAGAARAESALVREVVPPARHRRSRCRVVFRYADGTEADLTFVGDRRHPGTSSQEVLGEEITRWLSSGQPRHPAWLVPDPDASDGVAIDVTAWLATG